MKIKQVALCFLTLHLGLYLLIGDIMLEKQLLNEFEGFSERRLASRFNVENDTVWEQFCFSSCGDEFFRNHEKVKDLIKCTNPNRYKNQDFYVGENPKFILVENLNYYQNSFENYYRETEEVNIIHFGACRINKIPFVSTKIELKESFSTYLDFHSMYYNDQILNYKSNYIWLLFKWVRISNKPNSNF